ncbi:YtxH domain-containing protein [Fibrella forsythiae]|uniref:YtxH domain-containing protein n=1 Tax=Fibrella forsythiae TaxID=2817061 RepID=A0ABS3JKK1_9BACT|nr:YtxH domain-containing protein [Fibrella forsythiae]MBO0949936.1 YtxH domain-containing protein [Fibrella forsythiae]
MLFKTRKHPQDYLTDKTFLAGLLTGIASGLAVGLLLASRSGKGLRDQLSDSFDEQADKAQHKWAKTKSNVEDTIDTVKTNVGVAAEEVKDKAEQLADDTESGFDKLKNIAKFF